MDDPSPIAEGVHESGAGDRRRPPDRPRWVKVFGIVAAAVILLLLVLSLTGNNHGPGRHLGGEERPPGVEHAPPRP